MRHLKHFYAALVAAALAASCSSQPKNERIYTFQGQVLRVEPDGQALIKHGDIKGLMPAMTMTYKMKDPKLLTGVKAGDLIDATLVVVPDNAYVTQLKKTGEAPLDKAATDTADSSSASSGFELLKPGEPVPDGHFVDQDGKKRDFSAFKGSIVAVTFMYTKCPLPTFCPLMDRHFASVQKTIKSDSALKNVHLVSVSFDPITDTPPVLTQHARELEADPSRWTFLTGKQDDIDHFAARFGVAITRAAADPRDITHNLRTAIVDAGGNLVKVYIGNEWTPSQLLADLKAAEGRSAGD
jgi:protein SCO1/2